MTPFTDRHANARDRKIAQRKTGEALRGKRSVFEIQKSIAKRARDGRCAPRSTGGMK